MADMEDKPKENIPQRREYPAGRPGGYTRGRPGGGGRYSGGRPGGGAGKPNGPGQRSFGRRKVCYFCREKTDDIDYKNSRLLRRFVTDRGKIIPRRITGTCAYHQRILGRAIKRARTIALLPFKASS